MHLRRCALVPRACQTCAGDLDLSLDTTCAHGDEIDRCALGLELLPRYAEEARRDMEGGAPLVPGQEGNRYERAGRAVGISGSTLRRYAKVLERGEDVVIAKMLSRKMKIRRAWETVTQPGDEDDPDTWLTPQHILDYARSEIGGQRFDLDPCTIDKNPTNALTSYAKQKRNEDGRVLPWSGAKSIWINPPYSDIQPWIERAVKTVGANVETRIWMLIPASTDTAYGQLALSTASAICFLRGRVSHLRADGTELGSPEFGSMVVGFGAANLRHYQEVGVVLPSGPIAHSVLRLIGGVGYEEALRRVESLHDDEVAA